MTSTARRHAILSSDGAGLPAANDNRPSRRHSILSGEGAGLPARMTYAEGEREGVHREKVRLADRAKIGKDWDGEAHNDNSVWPLAKALLAEGNGDLLKYAMTYRRIYDRAKSAATLGGSGARIDEGFSLDRYTYVRPSGEVVYNRVRQSTAASVDIPARHYVAPALPDDADTQRNFTKVPKPWNGDAPVNDMMDAQRELARLNARMGPTVEPFEMACIDGATLGEVGNALGVANRAGSMGAGKALCHLALITIRDSLGPVERKELAA